MENNSIDMDKREFMDINSGREVFYNFLSHCYKKEVDEEFLGTVVSLVPYIESIASQSDIENLSRGTRLIRIFADKLTGLNAKDKDDLLIDLARDFSYLFLIGVKSVPCSESVYLSPEHLVKQEQRDMVLLTYREGGFTVSKDFKEPEDHIALECEFMARMSHLIGKSTDMEDYESISKYLACQKGFMEDHINKWIPQFVDRLIKTAEGRVFYQAIGYLTEGFMEMDYGFIKEAVIPSTIQLNPFSAVIS